MKVSNRLILSGLAIGMVSRIWFGGIRVVLPYLGNILFPVIVLFLLYLAGILGAADIKLFSVIGGFVTLKELVWCMALSFAVGALLALFRMVAGRTLLTRLSCGMGYIADLLRGNIHAYEQVEGRQGNLMHFAVAILIGFLLCKVLFWTGLA